MASLNDTIASGLVDRYRNLADQVKVLAAPLSNEEFWRKPFPYGNSFGHLVLHLTGNLSYYIGAEIAGTGYVRDRDLEFTDRTPPSKDEAMRRFDEAVAVVERTIREQSADDWSKDYTAARETDAKNRFGIVLRCVTHLHLHIGQMTYVSYQLRR